jgi:MFS transporter, DHA1 family, multidrug resistance protein
VLPRFLSFTALEPWRRTLYILFIAQLISAVGFSNIVPFLPLYVQHLGSESGLSIEFLAGMTFSAQAITGMIVAPVWGSLADRYGRKLMVQRAVFGGAILLLLMGFARSAEELVILRALQGLVTGILPASSALVAASAPRHNAGYAMGLLQLAHWSGIAIGPLLGGVTADWLGYRSAFIITAILVVAAGIVVQVGVQEVFATTISHDEVKAHLLSDLRPLLADLALRRTFAARFLGQLGISMILPIAPLFVQTLLPTASHVNTVTGAVIGLASASGMLTAVYLGRLGDKVGYTRVLAVSAFLAGILYLPQSLVTAAWQLLILQGLTGMAVGGIVPTLSALLANHAEPGKEGSVYGLDSSLAAASRALAPLVGAAFAFWFGLRSTFLVTGAIFLGVAALGVWYLPGPRKSAT